MLDVFFSIVGFVLGTVFTALVVLTIEVLRTTVPAKRRNEYLIAWLRRPLPSPRITDLYSSEWTLWIKHLVYDWKDKDRACMSVRTYLGSQAADAVERLERDLERYAVQYLGPFGHPTRESKRADADIERIFRRPVQR